MNRKHIPTTYDEARDLLKGRTSRNIANNTRLDVLEHDAGDDVIGPRLHSTYVVRFYSDGRITLHTGGWESVTTKDRLNRVARAHGWSVYAAKRVWYVQHRFGTRLPFAEGFTIAHGLAKS